MTYNLSQYSHCIDHDFMISLILFILQVSLEMAKSSAHLLDQIMDLQSQLDGKVKKKTINRNEFFFFVDLGSVSVERLF